MTTLSYKINNYRITLTHNENIYIKVIDEISLQTYENNIDLNEINVPFDRNDILNLIIDCLSLKENFNVSFIINSNCMKIIFDILFNLKYKYNFDVILNEKKINNNAKTECQYIKEIEDLNNKIEDLNDKFKDLNNKFERFMLIQEDKNKEIKELNDNINLIGNTFNIISEYGFDGCGGGKLNYYPINSEELIINGMEYRVDLGNGKFYENNEKTLKSFYKLKKLTILNSDIDESYMNSDKLKILILEKCRFKKFDFKFVKNLPLLEEIHFISCMYYDGNSIEETKKYLHKNIKHIFVDGEIPSNWTHMKFIQKDFINHISSICRERNIHFNKTI
jgi:hypothetical protein